MTQLQSKPKNLEKLSPVAEPIRVKTVIFVNLIKAKILFSMALIAKKCALLQIELKLLECASSVSLKLIKTNFF